MKGLPAIWFGLLLLALMTALTFWIDRTVQLPAPKRDGSTRHDVDYIVKNFSSIRTDGYGNPRYELSGVEMRHYPDDDSTDLVRPHYTIYSQKMQTTQIFSDKGKISANGENVYFVDNVKVVRAATPQKGEMTVLTSYLHVVPDQELAETNRSVTILQAPHTVVHANGMQYYKKEGIVNLYQRVKAHYEKPGDRNAKPLTIEQVVAQDQLFAKVPSVVKPASAVVPVVPSVKADTSKNTGKNKKTSQSSTPTSTKKTETSTNQQKKSKSSAAKGNKPSADSQKNMIKKSTANKANTGTKADRVRRHYEKP